MNLPRGLPVPPRCCEAIGLPVLNLSFPGERRGIFSAPVFVASNDRAVLKPLEKPFLDLLADLNRFEPCVASLNIPPGEGKGDEQSTGVGERANVCGGEEDRRTMADMMGEPGIAHRGRRVSANAKD